MAVVAVVFAITNRALVTLNLWPLGVTVKAPLFLILLGGVFVGLLIGGTVAWLSGAKARRRAREAERRSAELQREIARLQRERGPSAPSSAAGRPGPTTLPAGRG